MKLTQNKMSTNNNTTTPQVMPGQTTVPTLPVLASEVRSFVDFVEPNYKMLAKEHRNPAEVRAVWNDFWNNQLAQDFTVVGEKAKNLYFFNSHMGNAARQFDSAKDEWVKAVLAFHCERDNVKQ